MDTYAIPNTPYVGPLPFEAGGALYGRDLEQRQLVDMLISKRIVILISPSGAGKTSLIQAGILSYLHDKFDPLPLAPLPIVRLDQSAIAEQREESDVNPYVISTLRSWETHFASDKLLTEEELEQHTLSSYMATRHSVADEEKDTPFPLIILDQFEELFTVNRFDWSRKQAYIEQLGILLSNGITSPSSPSTPAQPVWALFSMREDYVAELEPYLHLIPTELAYRFRLEPLNRAQAIDAIHKPSNNYFEETAAIDLVSDLCQATQNGQALPGTQQGRYVDPVQLQVVSLRFWNKIVIGEQRPITQKDIRNDQRTNEVDKALAEYYRQAVSKAASENMISERKLRDWIKKDLVPRKIRSRVLYDATSDLFFVNAIENLINSHLLRKEHSGDRIWLELSHDRLIEPVIADNTEWLKDHLVPLQYQSGLWNEQNRPDDLLFRGEQLAEALKFAEAHKDELRPEEQAFLDESKKSELEEIERLAQQDKIAKLNAELEKNQQNLIHEYALLEAKQRRTINFSISALVLIVVLAATVTYKVTECLSEQVTQTEHDLSQKTLEAEAAAKEASSQLSDSYIKAAAVETNSATALKKLISLDLSKQPQLEPDYLKTLFTKLGSTPPISTHIGEGRLIRKLVYSSDGKRIFSGDWNGQVKAWSTLTALPGTTITSGKYAIQSMSYNSNRQLMATADRSGNIKIFNTQDQTTTLLFEQTLSVISNIISLDIDPTGQWLAISYKESKQKNSKKQVIELWNIANPSQPKPETRRLELPTKDYIYHVNFITSGEFAGSLIASSANEGSVYFWPHANGPLPVSTIVQSTWKPETYLHRKTSIFSLDIHPSGRWMALGSKDGNIIILDLRAMSNHQENLAGAILPTQMHLSKVTGLSFSKDGHFLYSVGGDERLIKWTMPENPNNLNQLISGIQARPIEGWGEKLYSISPDPVKDGFVAVGGGRTIWTSDLSKPNPIANKVQDSEERWHSTKISADGLTLVTLSSSTQKVSIWSIKNGVPTKQESIEPKEYMVDIAVSSDGKLLATINKAGILRIRNREAISTPVYNNKFNSPPSRDESKLLAFRTSDNLLIGASGNEIRTWKQTQPGNWIKLADATLNNEDNITSIALNLDGSRLAVASHDPLDNNKGMLNLWSIDKDGRLKKETETEHTEQPLITEMTFSPNSQRLATGGENNSVMQWTVPDLAKASIHENHDREIRSLAYVPLGNTTLLASGDNDGQLILCALPETLDCSAVGKANGAPISSLSVTRNIFFVTSDAIWTWDLRSENLETIATQLADKRVGAAARKLDGATLR